MKEQGRNLQRTVTALGDLYDRVGAIDGKGTPLGTEFRPIPIDEEVEEGDVEVRVEEEEERVPEEPAAPAEEVVSDSEVEVVASPPRRSVWSRSRSSRRSRRSSPEV